MVIRISPPSPKKPNEAIPAARLENTTTATDFDTSKTIDGANLLPGDVLEVMVRVWVEDQNLTDTLTLDLYLGTEKIVTTGAVDVADPVYLAYYVFNVGPAPQAPFPSCGEDPTDDGLDCLTVIPCI